MKRCPECRRNYSDETLNYCLDDGSALLEGPASMDEPATAILTQGRLTGEADTRTFRRDEPIPAKISKRNSMIAGAIGILLVTTLGIGSYLYYALDEAEISSIAVMPFVNESGSADLDYLSDGMTESLINTLTQLPGLKVKPRSSAFRYKGRESDAKVIGGELQVSAILNGRLVQRGDDITLFLSLIDTATEDQIWGKQYNRKFANLVSLQAEVARDVSDNLRSKLTGADSQLLAKKDTTDPEAYRLYLQGRYFWNKRRIGDTGKAIGFFQQAIDLDPNYARAYAGLADAVAQPSDVVPHLQRKGRARAAALKALELEDGLAEAHSALAHIILRYELDFAGAERELELASRLDRNWPDTYQRYGELYLALGRFDEADAKFKQGLAIEPFNLPLNTSFGAFLTNSRRFDEAIIQLKKTIDIDPDYRNAHVGLAMAYSLKGMYAEAIKHRVISLKLAGQDAFADRIRDEFSKGGWPAVIHYEIDRFQTLDRSQWSDRWPFYSAANRLSLIGEKDKAFAALERSVEAHEQPWLVFLRVDPQFDGLRDDPRFAQLLDRLGFPK